MESPKKSRLPNLALVLGIALATLLLAHLAANWSYYSMPIERRPLDPRHSSLRPSGRHGLVFAMVGTTAMLLNLTYLVRKRLGALTWLGSLRNWMRFHVLTGLLGPALVLFHAAFVPTSALGKLALVALLIVLFTGIIGRYIYTHVPRSYRGRELELGEVRRRLADHREDLKALGVEAACLEDEPALGPEATGDVGVLSALRSLLAGDREARRQFRELRNRILRNGESSTETSEIAGLLRKLCRERQWLLHYHELRGLMSSWRFFHRWLAILLLLVVGFHIALAWRFGNLWILTGG